MRHCILTALITFAVSNLVAQQPIILESNLNDSVPGAVYKYSFVHLTDIHIGEGIADYGTPGTIGDTMPAGDVGYAAQRLRSAINWINSYVNQKNIRFVIVTGDLTDSAEQSEFDKAKEILDDLTIPYVPQMGNHDVRPHTNTDDTDTAENNIYPHFIGDSMVNATFAETFDSLRNFFSNWNDGSRLTRVYSPYALEDVYLQNFSFEYQGFAFFFADFNPRFVNRPAGNIGPSPRLNNFENGAFPWLMNAIQDYPNKGTHNMMLFSHEPTGSDFYALPQINGFPAEEYKTLTDSLYHYQEHLGWWLAGHIHRNAEYVIKTTDSLFVMNVKETSANKDSDYGILRLVNVYESPAGIVDETLEKAIKIIPNPNTGNFSVSLPAAESLYVLEVIDLSGRPITQPKTIAAGQSSTQMQLGNVTTGNYILKVTSGNRIARKMFVKAQ